MKNVWKYLSIIFGSTTILLFILLISTIIINGNNSKVPVFENNIYYIGDNNGNKQIYRIDKTTLLKTKITDEENGIDYFDISKRDGSIVFIREQDLIVLQPGQKREIIIQKQLTTEKKNIFCSHDCILDTNITKSSLIVHPIISDDGKYIAFNNNGLFIYSLENMQLKLIIPDEADGKMYYPFSFSPDGNYLLLKSNISTFGGGDYYIFDNRIEKLINLEKKDEEGFSVCQWDIIWTSDSKYLLNSINFSAGACTAGLYIYDLDGKATSIVRSKFTFTEQVENRVFAPYRLSDDGYYYLFLSVDHKLNTNTEFMDPRYFTPYQLVHTSTNGNCEVTILRPEYYLLASESLALWKSNDEGLLLYEQIGKRLIYISTNISQTTSIISYGEEDIELLKWGG